MNLQFGVNLFGEQEIQQMFASMSGKWVIHLKAIGLLETNADENSVWHWYAEKGNIQVLNALINSGDALEVYVLLDSMDDVTDAYESWFPREGELLDTERKYYVRFKAMSPDGQYIFTNEKSEPTE